MGRRGSPNTHLGGHAARVVRREISADPAGNREQRRAAKKLGIEAPPERVLGDASEVADV